MTSIACTPDTCGGEARIDGTRIMVRNVLGSLMGADGFAAVRKSYPSLTDEEIVAALGYTVRALNVVESAMALVASEDADTESALYIEDPTEAYLALRDAVGALKEG